MRRRLSARNCLRARVSERFVFFFVVVFFPDDSRCTYSRSQHTLIRLHSLAPPLPPSMRLCRTMKRKEKKKKQTRLFLISRLPFAVHLAHPSLPPADPLD